MHLVRPVPQFLSGLRRMVSRVRAPRAGSRPALVPALFVIVFLTYALNFSYFFVDDQAIPYVYAQNVLDGHGLSYNPDDGRVEGYSNFLHVWIATAILALVRGAGWPKVSVFFIGSALSLGAGALTIYAVCRTLRRLPTTRPAGVWAALTFLALAGPLALWSCSSLETAFFAAALTIFTGLLLTAPSVHGTRLALACAIVVLLDRIDGFVYVGAILAGAVLFADRERRRHLVTGVILPTAVVFLVYQVWRVWYFGALLPLPLYAKVAYKLLPHAGVVRKDPQVPYLLDFFRLYSWPIAVVPIAGLALSRHTLRRSWSIGLALLLLLMYLSLVGDWMFGFRFFVALLPMMAILIGIFVSEVERRSRMVGWCAVAAVTVWVANAAYGFEQRYIASQHRPSWLSHPSMDVKRYFAPYYALYEQSRPLLHAGDTIAYNQAGFLPFMGDVKNIDDLGICTSFFATLPTTDVAFTEVGRYTPMTRKGALKASEAYLLYREPRFVIGRTDNLRNANAGRIPESILGGYYERAATDPTDQNVIYGRSARSVARFRREPRLFLENLAHISRLRSAWINDALVPAASYRRTLAFLVEERALFSVNGSFTLELDFGPEDLDIYELDIEGVYATHPSTFMLTLLSATGAVVHTRTFDASEASRDVREYLPEKVRAGRLRLRISSPPAVVTRVMLHDLRVQGQTPGLIAYLRDHVQFDSQ